MLIGAAIFAGSVEIDDVIGQDPIHLAGNVDRANNNVRLAHQVWWFPVLHT